MDQVWFEMARIRRRRLDTAVWIPLRASHVVSETGEYGYVGHQSEFFGVGSIAVPCSQKGSAEKLGWMDIGSINSHSGYLQENKYIPADMYKGYGEELDAVNLVLEQRGNRAEPPQWHLHEDFSVTLGLKREGNSWVRIDEGYIEIARIEYDEAGAPSLLEVRASHLRDYLCAREMALYASSYRSRVEIVENADHIIWDEGTAKEEVGQDRWEGRVTTIHEGGHPFGESAAVFHVARNDVDEDEDVPSFEFPTDDVIESNSWTKSFDGRKLYRIEGELWRNEWVDPATVSPIVRGDETTPTVFFITDAEGTQESKETLNKAGRWLWFRPDVMSALAHRRGGSLSWYTRDTGSVGCSPDYTVHFGVNKLGLVNVYAKDIGLLPDWQQRIWAGFNVSPDGKVSEELLASQMKARPANTQAPEAFLRIELERLSVNGREKLGIEIIRPHDFVLEVLTKTHRFRAIDNNGLYALAKDVARVTADSIDAREIQKLVPPPANEKWGSLKSLEKLLATRIDPAVARGMVGSLVGAYELRHGDAHLPGQELDTAFALVGIDRQAPFVFQGRQLLHACVASIHGIADVIDTW